MHDTNVKISATVSGQTNVQTQSRYPLININTNCHSSTDCAHTASKSTFPRLITKLNAAASYPAVHRKHSKSIMATCVKAAHPLYIKIRIMVAFQMASSKTL